MLERERKINYIKKSKVRILHKHGYLQASRKKNYK